MEVNSLNLFQPKPSVSDNSGNVEKKYELIKSPNVGVIQPPVVSKTPISDTLTLKKQENPRMAYKQTINIPKIDFINSITSVVVAACSIFALFNLKK